MLGLTAGPSKETEQEKMIRLGEMTPFGTVVAVKKPPRYRKLNDVI